MVNRFINPNSNFYTQGKGEKEEKKIIEFQDVVSPSAFYVLF
jgi:hypothetical protein